MPSISIDLDVRLDDFETTDLAEELYRRLYQAQSKAHSDAALKRLLALITTLHEQFFDVPEDLDDPDTTLPVHSVLDQMKVEYMQQIFEKYTLSQIENALPL